MSTLQEQQKKGADLKKNDAPATEAAKYNQYVGMVTASGYKLDESVGNVNVIGIRGWLNGNVVENVRNKYNDSLIAIYQTKDAGGKLVKHCSEFIASVDPGKYDYESSSKGDAHLMAGQYDYQYGWHNGYRAFNQAGKVRVWRDANKNGKRDEGEIDEEGFFSINIHAAGNKNATVGPKTAGKRSWSEGCQVIASNDTTQGSNNSEFLKFRDIILKNDTDKKFKYTLLEGDKAKEKYDEKMAGKGAVASPAEPIVAKKEAVKEAAPKAEEKKDAVKEAVKTDPSGGVTLAKGTAVVATKSGSLNIREQNKKDSRWMGALSKGSKFAWFDEKDSWLKVVTENKFGWVSKDFTSDCKNDLEGKNVLPEVTVSAEKSKSSANANANANANAQAQNKTNQSSNSGNAGAATKPVNGEYKNFTELAGVAFDKEIRTEGEFDQVFYDLNDRADAQYGVINLGSGSAMGFGQYTKGVGGIDVTVGDKASGVKLHFESDVKLNEAISAAFGNSYLSVMKEYQAYAFSDVNRKASDYKTKKKEKYRAAVNKLVAIGGKTLTDSNGKTAKVAFTGKMGYLNVYLSDKDVAEIRAVNFNTDAGYCEEVQNTFFENTKDPNNIILKDFIHMVHAASSMKYVINKIAKSQDRLNILANAVKTNTVTNELCTMLYTIIKNDYKGSLALAGAVVRQLEKSANASDNKWKDIAKARLAAIK